MPAIDIHMRRDLFLIILLLLPLSVFGQWERFGGVYFAYPEAKHPQTKAPSGYEPFYISHFARHGSRWLPDDNRYIRICQQFDDTLNLTPLGKDVRRRLLQVYADAKGRGGDLTAIGAGQHRRMAERMIARWPEIFRDSAQVSARSSIVGRCVMSMNAFLIRLAQLRPSLKITAESNRRYMDYIAYTSDEEKALEDRTHNRWTMNPSRLMLTLFKDTSRIANPYDLASELHTIASDMQNVGIGVSLYDLFTEEEMRQIYDMNNERMELCNGINPKNDGIPQRCALSLWNNIVASADSAIAKGRPAATLRFGHDTSLYRLLSLLGLYANEKRMDVIIPMGANLQMVFYRSKQGGPTLVKFLHNEQEVLLPLPSTTAPYYEWNEVKRYYDRKISGL